MSRLSTFTSEHWAGGNLTTAKRFDVSETPTLYLVKSHGQLTECTHDAMEAVKLYNNQAHAEIWVLKNGKQRRIMSRHDRAFKLHEKLYRLENVARFKQK